MFRFESEMRYKNAHVVERYTHQFKKLTPQGLQVRVLSWVQFFKYFKFIKINKNKQIMIPLFEEYTYNPDSIVKGEMLITNEIISQFFQASIDGNSYLYKLAIHKDTLIVEISEVHLSTKVDYNNSTTLYKIFLTLQLLFDTYFKQNVLKHTNPEIKKVYINQEYLIDILMTDIAKINRISDSILSKILFHSIKTELSFKDDNILYKLDATTKLSKL